MVAEQQACPLGLTFGLAQNKIDTFVPNILIRPALDPENEKT
jgi:hypothetical protein